MNILFVSYRIYPCETGGTEVFNFHLADRLSRSNSVTLLTHCNKKIGETELIRIKKHKPSKFITPIKLFFHVLKNRKSIDVIFLSYMKSHWFGWSLLPIIKKITKIPYIITIHGGGLTPWKPNFVYRWSFINASRLIGISRRICIEYEKRTGLEVKYIPPLFPFYKSEKDKHEIKKKYGIPQNSKILLYVGSLKELKSPETLLTAFNSLGPHFIKRHNLYLIFAGDGTLRDNLIKNIKHSDRTLLLGNVPRREMPELFKISDIYIITSKFEGTPLSLLEAIYNLVPVIGSDVKGTKTIINDQKNGMLYSFGDYDELSSCIRKLLENEELGIAYAKAAEKTYIDNYSYDKVLEEYKAIFNGVSHE